MKSTNIQWTHSTINPTSGCDGCELARRPPPNLTPEQFAKWLSEQECYALQVHERRWSKSLAITHPEMYAKHFFELRTIAGRMAKAAAWGLVTDDEAKDKPWFTTRRRHIFVSDMSDALSRDVPFEFLRDEIIAAAASKAGQRHIFQWLTKRPERMAEFDAWLADQGVAWPANLWAGTSVTRQRTADVRVPAIKKVRALVHFLSCEPLFEATTPDLTGIEWVIVGGASGSDPAAFDLRWARSIVQQCQQANVRCFVKQLGANPVICDGHDEVRLVLEDSHGGDWNEWPEDLRVRQVPAAPSP